MRVIGSVIGVRRFLPARLAVEGHEHQAERVERRDEHAGHHAPVRVRRDPVGRLQVVLSFTASMMQVLRIEAREERRADQRQRTDPAGDAR